MTEASKGLRKALARSAGGDLIALSELGADEILAGLSDDQRVALSASLQPAKAGKKPENDPAEVEPDDDDDDMPAKSKKKMDGGSSASAQPIKSSASINERVKAVAAAVATDDTCKGKADVALAMLADDDFIGLSASAVIKMVGNSVGSSVIASDPEDAARAEMRAALAKGSNSQIDAGAGGAAAKTSAEASASVWDTAIANEFPAARK